MQIIAYSLKIVLITTTEPNETIFQICTNQLLATFKIATVVLNNKDGHDRLNYQPNNSNLRYRK